MAESAIPLGGEAVSNWIASNSQAAAENTQGDGTEGRMTELASNAMRYPYQWASYRIIRATYRGGELLWPAFFGDRPFRHRRIERRDQ